jgi:site-specific DNA-methyltransferase (adenine-specific)
MLLMARYPDNYFDLAIVDPPYGIDIAKWDSIDLKPSQEYFNELFRVSKNQIIWGGNYFNLPHSEGWICWDKTFKYNQKLAVGHFELAWSNLDIKHSFIRFTSCGNFQGFENPKANYEKKKSFHPTSKPIEIYKFCLDKYAKENDKILDTHLGSGSIAIACHDYKFELTACELDKEYYDKAIQRIKNHTNQTKLF